MLKLCVCFLCAVSCVFPSLAASPAAFSLCDYVGRTWQNECVEFPLSPAQASAARARKALVGPNGQPVLYQLVPGTTKKMPARIAFLADLDPYETRAYRFTASTAKVATDLRIEETADLIRISNALTGIAIRKKLTAGNGPVDSIRLNSGPWVGGSQLSGCTQPLTAYTTDITARGPAFAELRCRATFAGANQWSITFRVHANEPVILVDEQYALGDGSAFILNLSRGLPPDHVLYRDGASHFGQCTSWHITAGDAKPVFVLEPWLHWGSNDRQGQWFAVYNDASADVLSLGTRDAGSWVEPKNPASLQQSFIYVKLDGEQLGATFPLSNGTRRWMIGAHGKDASLAVLKEKEGERCRAPLPQRYVIKHGHFPLNRVKDYVFLPPQDEAHPRLFITKAQAQQFRKTFQADPVKLAEYTRTPVNRYEMENWITYYLGTGDPALGKQLSASAIQLMQEAINEFFDQDYPPAFGIGNSNDKLLQGAHLADAILDSDQLPAELRQRLRTQIAFLGYTVNRDDFWSPERGFCANPNMTTRVAAFRATLGCMLPSHPQAKSWVDSAMRELKDNELDTWSDAKGGWLEAPHYAMLSYDFLLGCFLMTHNSGFNDYVFDPKMKQIAEWFANIATPPDSRIKGWRHHPPIGNTYINEPSGQFALVASIWKERDPAFAAQMQWMYRQQGAQSYAGIGGAFSAFTGYRTLLTDTRIVEKAPAYGSILFPETGVVLRNRYPSDRETMLHMIAGSHFHHYDYDSGSITLWGKGRIITDDFGYYGRAPVNDHSMVETPLSSGVNMRINEFVTTAPLDYVRGVLNGWTRQIVLMKDADPLGPNYVVLCDTLRETAPATWRLWLTCNTVTLRPQGALVAGKEDVDTEVFFALPAGVELTTETKSRRAGCGLNAEGNADAITTTQIGLIAAKQDTRVFTALIYPRLKTERPPIVTTIADGKGVKVESTAGVDYVFLCAERFQFNDAEITFDGTVGSIQRRGGHTRLSLGAAGSISSQGQQLHSDKAATQDGP